MKNIKHWSHIHVRPAFRRIRSTVERLEDRILLSAEPLIAFNRADGDQPLVVENLEHIANKRTADQLDLRRADAARHLAFGSGTHHCLGASLARMEGTIAITRLIRRFPELQAMGPPAWTGRLVLRGMDSLQLSLR